MSGILIYFPFIYFLILFLFIYRQNGFDVASLVAFLYVVTSAFAIPYWYGFSPGSRIEINIIPTFFYCLGITVVIYPFYKFKSNRAITVRMANSKLFDFIVYFYFISFVFMLILLWQDMMIRLAMGDAIGELRGADDAYLDTAQSRLVGPLRFISNVFAVMNSISPIMFMFFFYSICFLHKKWWFNMIILLSSLGTIIASIIGIDRSMVFYFIIEMFLAYVIFKRYIPKKKKIYIYLFGGLILFGAVSYMVMLTMSRFGQGDNDIAKSSVIDYAGQSFIYFCFFWDNFQLPELNPAIFFPITNHFLGGQGAVAYGYELELSQGFFINQFYTFMGSIMIYMGKFVAILYCFVYAFIARIVLKRSKRIVSFSSLLLLFIFAIIPYCGAILYILTDYIREMGYIIMLIAAHYLRKGTRKVKYKTKHKNAKTALV